MKVFSVQPRKLSGMFSGSQSRRFNSCNLFNSFNFCHSTAALCLAALPVCAAIPDRPERLSFPPLVYEPPAPEKFRVELKTGPVAYVVPDHELPLVNIIVYAHTGQYLE